MSIIPTYRPVPVSVRVRQAPITVRNRVALKNSTFLITANTNYRPQTEREAVNASNILRDAVHNAFGSDMKIRAMTKFLDNQVWSSRIVRKVDVTIAVEIGQDPRGRRVHAHIVVDIDHFSKIHLDPVAIKRAINNDMDYGLRVYYVNIRAQTTNRSLIEYLEKDE